MRSSISALVALIALSGIGCQSSTQPSPQAAAPGRAVVVSSGNGDANVVYLDTGNPANPVRLCSKDIPECPECRAAAVKYFETGVLDPKCSRTGATRTAATAFPPNYGHN